MSQMLHYEIHFLIIIYTLCSWLKAFTFQMDFFGGGVINLHVINIFPAAEGHEYFHTEHEYAAKKLLFDFWERHQLGVYRCIDVSIYFPTIKLHW